MIAWLFDSVAIRWTSFIPVLGTVNYALMDGAVLWVVSDGPQEIAVGAAPPEEEEVEEPAPLKKEEEEKAPKEPEEKTLAQLEVVTFQADDGTNLVADLWSGSNTWILYAHQNGRDRSAWGELPMQTPATTGFTALAWDFRGFGDSDPGELTEITRDWQAAIDFAVSQGAVLIIGVGASMGGTSGLVVAAEDPRLSSLLLISSPANFLGVDALAAAPNATQPLVFVAGDADGNAAADAQAMLDAAPNALNRIVILETGLHGNDLVDSPLFDEDLIFGG